MTQVNSPTVTFAAAVPLQSDLPRVSTADGTYRSQHMMPSLQHGSETNAII